MTEGVLPIWKPVDYTSHDVVAKARRILRIKRIGHTGTLDPKVTGVLPLCIGRATRLVEYIQDLPKEYEAVLTLGLSTDTEDLTGEVLERLDRVTVSAEEITRVLASFVGTIDQVPPMYSAVKVDGKRLYELAREGATVERKSRQVDIYRIDALAMDLDRPHPEIRFRVSCSKGTYIRTLCVDIGRALGVPAVMSELVRTATGSLTRANCVTFEELEQEAADGTWQRRLLAPDDAVPHLAAVTLAAPEQAVHALQGRKLLWAPDTLPEGAGDLIRLYSPERAFLGIFRADRERGLLLPEKVFQ
ncbi:tRNA pseudouridine synthase B [Paenibacillus sp. J31TS4]|uniref:tRNA pseudouridine(55) synthase TruB n=1 Tax=Paenibacillus sp. J31TS4 TaxID=2807195 RepID=UPI001B07EE3F|nr:tRNA pseudouridine(55) synthase TruB [Paenibacillus sp. J31TS4]GIP36860.1 tRNA pseudouridine synthase B [Paenibacillus sp. J31TS4]